MPNEAAVAASGGILALVPDDWCDPPQRRHQVLKRLAARFPVAWVSPGAHWRERRRSESSESRPHGDRMRVFDAGDGLPSVYRPRWLQQALYRRRVLTGLRWLERRGCRAIELQLWRPEYAAALDWISYRAASYHVDDEYSWSTADLGLSPAERLVLQRCDRVFVTSPGLFEKKGGVARDTRLAPNGVDFAAFAAPAPEPNDVASLPRPRIGYAGVLKTQLDWELLASLAAARPQWSFVLVGPVRRGHDEVQQHLGALGRLPNVHALGRRPANSLPGYLQHMDVALLPYRRNAYTDCIDPLKLYEALAAGTPVVASRLRTMEDFTGVVRLATTRDDFIAGIADALADRSPARRLQRQAVARARDWDTIVRPIAESIAEALGTRS